ncbi:MAG: hypothetical protein Q7S50_04650 [bacterium]|nr:hypothetical protein [bacterium]
MPTKKPKLNVAAYAEGIRIALAMLDDLGLTLLEKVRLFGLDGRMVGEDVAAFERQLTLMRSFDIEARYELVFDIKSRLEGLFGVDSEEQRHWIEKTHHQLDGRTFKSLLVSGQMAELERAEGFLYQITG